MCQTTSVKEGGRGEGLWMCTGESFPNNICNESNICNERKGGEVRREEEKILNWECAEVMTDAAVSDS